MTGGNAGMSKVETHLVLPSDTSATPYSSRNWRSSGRYWSSSRPSSRRSSLSAVRIKTFSLTEGSASRGIVSVLNVSSWGYRLDRLLLAPGLAGWLGWFAGRWLRWGGLEEWRGRILPLKSFKFLAPLLTRSTGLEEQAVKE